MPDPLRRRCMVAFGPEHPRKPNWQCPRAALKDGDRCRYHTPPSQRRRPEITLTVEGKVIDEATLRRLVEAEMLRLGRRGPYLR